MDQKDSMRVIRMSCSDPNATDSESEDDQNVNGKRDTKRFIKEIIIKENRMKKEQKKQGSSPSRLPKGVTRRRSGKFSTEIPNPITKRKLWLGTYDTKEKAGSVFCKKRLEFNRIIQSIKRNKGLDKDCTFSSLSASGLVPVPVEDEADQKALNEKQALSVSASGLGGQAILDVKQDPMLSCSFSEEAPIMVMLEEGPPSVIALFPEDQFGAPNLILNEEINQDTGKYMQLDELAVSLNPIEEEADSYFKFEQFYPWDDDWGPMPWLL